MSRAHTWMPLYIGDYQSDTADLTMEQSGCYLHLLMYQWRRGSLPADDASLARICRSSRTHWQRHLAPVLLPFFECIDGGLIQRRLAAERQKVAKTSESRSSAAQKRWAKSAPDSANVNDVADAKASVLHMPGMVQSEKHKKEKIQKATPSAQVPSAPAPDGGVIEVLSARDMMWRHGPGTIAFLTGKSDRQCRQILGKMLADTRDDAMAVMQILDHCRSLHPLASPAAHLLECARTHSGARPRTAARHGDMSEWADRLKGFGNGRVAAAAHVQPDIDLKAESVG